MLFCSVKLLLLFFYFHILELKSKLPYICILACLFSKRIFSNPLAYFDKHEAIPKKETARKRKQSKQIQQFYEHLTTAEMIVVIKLPQNSQGITYSSEYRRTTNRLIHMPRAVHKAGTSR